VAGVVYILTNPSFPNFIKIGYATDIQQRLRTLNRSECVPYAFRIYATYEVDSNLSDLQVHKIIDSLRPDLRTRETVHGRTRTREFYAMAAQEAYSLFCAMAEIHGTTDRLKLYPLTSDEQRAEQEAQIVEDEQAERQSNFSFSRCHIVPGALIEYINDPALRIEVVDDRKVLYNGETMSLTALAKLLTGVSYAIAGPRYFKYQGEGLNDIRHRLGV